MSDRLTSISLPGLPSGTGIADWGRLSASEMIKQYRAYAAYQMQWAEKVIAAKDEDFRVETYVGIHVMKNRETIQEGKT